MWQDDMTKAETLIDAHQDFADFDGTLGQENIIKAAGLLGLSFPAPYAHFLSKFGVGAFGATEIYGLIDGNIPANSVPCAVFATLSERQSDGSFPQDFIVIQSSGFGPLYCLATSEMVNGDCPVRVWNYLPVVRDSETLVSTSFAGHLLKIVEDEIFE